MTSERLFLESGHMEEEEEEAEEGGTPPPPFRDRMRESLETESLESQHSVCPRTQEQTTHCHWSKTAQFQ